MFLKSDTYFMLDMKYLIMQWFIPQWTDSINKYDWWDMINESGKWKLANEKSQMKNCTSLMRNKNVFAYLVSQVEVPKVEEKDDDAEF